MVPNLDSQRKRGILSLVYVSMTVKIDSRFATSDETAEVLGLPSKRVKELRKLIEASMKARRASGISWVAPAATRSVLLSALAARDSEKAARRSSAFRKTKEAEKAK